MFGIGMPFLKAYDKDGDISVQIKDNKGNGRYWKEVFEFNGKFYLIVSQWQEFNRERFNKWLNTLGN